MTLVLLFTGIEIVCFASVLILVSVIVKRNDIADVAWGIGISIVALHGYVFQSSSSILGQTLTLLIIAWGIRLSLRIFLRNIKKTEDVRYKVWRETWGKWFYVRSYAQVYLLQGFLMIVVGYPALHVSVYGAQETLSTLSYIGIGIWLVGFLFETVGDYQLDAFIKSKPPQGAILDTGLWKYTRHPNYFGEVTQWWGIWCMMLTVPYGYVAVISPLMITFLIFKVSGIPMLEKHFEGNPLFVVYKEKTSAFFPMFPKR